jgi:hypothetical protein
MDDGQMGWLKADGYRKGRGHRAVATRMGFLSDFRLLTSNLT